MKKTFVLDTDILTLYFYDHANVKQRVENTIGYIGITVFTRIEVLQGRFDFLLKAANGAELQKAMAQLAQSERDLNKFRKSFHEFPVDGFVAANFDKLSKIKKLKKIGRRDLLIASATLANKATLVTRNLKHFKQIPQLKVENWAE